ncbi:MAG TPA: TolC family protein, partial [Spirochaetia bacterium]|nr:TolC family protein [Spirochaetia bacterium]
LRRRGGTATEDAALELELAAETLRAAREETRLSLRDAERRLAGLLGLAEAPALSGRLPALAPAPAPEPRTAPEAARAALALERAAADAAARAVSDAASFGASLSLEPRYPDTRADPDDLGSVLSDYFGGGTGAGMNLNLTLTLDVPLSVREARALRSRSDALAARAAAANLRAAEQTARERARALEERRAFLADRVEIQKRIADLSRRKWERLRDLAAAGTVPADEADAARTDWDRAVSDVLRTEVDLVLAELDIRILRGEDLAVVLAGAK